MKQLYDIFLALYDSKVVDEDTPLTHSTFMSLWPRNVLFFPLCFSCDLYYSEKNEVVQFCGLHGAVALL